MNLPKDKYFDKRLVARNLDSKLVSKEAYAELLAATEDCADKFEYVNIDHSDTQAATPEVQEELAPQEG